MTTQLRSAARTLRALTSSLCVVSVVACSGESTAPQEIREPVSSVEFAAPPNQFMVKGGTQQLSVVPKNAEGEVLTGTSVIWSSSDDDVATVSPTGLVTALDDGITSIAATSDGRSIAFPLRVADAVGTVTIEYQDDVLEAGSTHQLIARVRDGNGVLVPSPTLSWTSSNNAVAKVTSSGQLTLTGTDNDSVVVTAAIGGKSGTFRFFSWPALANDVPITVDGTADRSRWFVMRTAPGVSRLTITLAGGSGDADLYVWSPGTWAGATQVCESVSQTSTESCVIDAPTSGLWSIEVFGYSAYANVQLRAVRTP